MTDHTTLQDEERQHILEQIASEGLDVDACRSMSFKDLRDMWSDYLSDKAMMEGRIP